MRHSAGEPLAEQVPRPAVSLGRALSCQLDKTSTYLYHLLSETGACPSISLNLLRSRPYHELARVTGFARRKDAILGVDILSRSQRGEVRGIRH